MSKLKNMAVFSAMLVGVIMYASPVKSAVCFLPDDDGSCGGGDIEISDGSDSDGNKKEEKCEGFPVSATEYEKMKNCFDFTSCTKSKNKEVKYKKGAQKENTTWSNGICCTNGKKYFSKQGQCCPTTGCACSGGRVWNPSTEQCECPEGKEFVGGVCTCAGNTVPDSKGNCILPDGCTYQYRQATTADSCGLRNFENTTKCMDTINGCQCYTQLIKVSSITAGAGYVVPYNKISNKSATCVDEKGVTKYQTICKGTTKSSCSARGKNYEFKPNGCVSDTYNNGFEVKGDEWGDCVEKEEKCHYQYTLASRSNTCGNGGNLDDGNSCQKGTCCYDNLSKVKSIRTENGEGNVMPIYNRISNASASCVTLDGVTKYETICEGTPKSACFRFSNNMKFTPNGCVSFAYNNDFEVKGTEWGTCGCDESKGAYATIEKCRSGTNSGCTTSSGGCYQTCESQGYYSTKEACLNSDYKVTCTKTANTGDCYKREMQGFLIKYDTTPRKADCGHTSYHAEAVAFLNTVEYNSERKEEYAGPAPETVDGGLYQELPEDNSKGYQYPAGTYYLCYQKRCSAISGPEQGCPKFNLEALQLLRTSDYNPEFTQEVCFTDNDSGYVGSFGTCNKNTRDAPNNNYPCKKVTFRAGKIYKVKFAISGMYDSSCTYK